MTDGSVQAAARAVLLTADPLAKAQAARAAAERLAGGGLSASPHGLADWPERPARPDRPALRPPSEMPRRGAAGRRGRIALLHALAHIELNAIDLACDLAGRFLGDPAVTDPGRFAADWLGVAAEEGMHFQLLCARLAELGSQYGDLPAHDGLWSAAHATRHDLGARLAIAPLVFEARGLDVTPDLIHKLTRAGDVDSAQVLARILADEVGHVAIGLRWFREVARSRGSAPEPLFHKCVKSFHPGGLKAPFNADARMAAGFGPDFYLDPQLRISP